MARVKMRDDAIVHSERCSSALKEAKKGDH